MGATTRTDIHRPSAEEFDPADYEFTGAVFDLMETAPNANREELGIRSRLLRAGYTENVPAHLCTHCGARLRYSALMIHLPTSALIYVGETCLDGRFAQTREAFRAAHGRAAAERKRQKLLKNFLAECEKHPALVYATYAVNIEQAADKREFWGKTLFILGDIADRARTSGKPISDKQAALLDKLLTDLDEQGRKQAARKAEWAAADAERVDAFIGDIGDRVTVTGTVRFAKIFEGGYGESTLLIIDTEQGTVKWFATGDHLDEQGEEITLKATVKAHDFFNDRAVTVVTRGRFQHR